eukprot:gene25328-biopygen20971
MSGRRGAGGRTGRRASGRAGEPYYQETSVTRKRPLKAACVLGYLGFKPSSLSSVPVVGREKWPRMRPARIVNG